MQLQFIKRIKMIFKAFAVGIFMYQMTTAMDKFLNPPVFKKVSISSVKDGLKPIIYVCNLDQFNYTAANQFGYVHNFAFVIGEVNRSVIDWRGR